MGLKSNGPTLPTVLFSVCSGTESKSRLWQQLVKRNLLDKVVYDLRLGYAALLSRERRPGWRRRPARAPDQAPLNPLAFSLSELCEMIVAVPEQRQRRPSHNEPLLAFSLQKSMFNPASLCRFSALTTVYAPYVSSTVLAGSSLHRASTQVEGETPAASCVDNYVKAQHSTAYT